jgi:hypothetical protein
VYWVRICQPWDGLYDTCTKWVNTFSIPVVRYIYAIGAIRFVTNRFSIGREREDADVRKLHVSMPLSVCRLP